MWQRQKGSEADSRLCRCPLSSTYSHKDILSLGSVLAEGDMQVKKLRDADQKQNEKEKKKKIICTSNYKSALRTEKPVIIESDLKG